MIVLAEQYNKIINMEMVPKEKIYAYIFKKNPDLMAAVTGTGNSTMSEFATKSLGVGNPNMVVNLSLIGLTFFLLLMAITLMTLFFKYKEKVFARFPWSKKYAYDIKHMLMWNSIIRSFIQSYLQMSVNAVLSIKLMSVVAEKDPVNDSILLITFIALILFPVGCYIFLYKMAHHRPYKDKKPIEKPVEEPVEEVKENEEEP